MQGSLFTIGLSAPVPHKSFLKVSIRWVSNFSEVITSDQFSPQQIQCRYHNGKNILGPPYSIQVQWCSYDCGYPCISEPFSFLWNSEFHTNSTLWNSIFHTMDLMFHNVECKTFHTSSTQNSLNMFYYDH